MLRQNHLGGDAVEIETIPVTPKLNKRFYEALLLLNTMSKGQGEHIREDTSILKDEPSNLLNEVEAWKAFLMSVAYICDAEKGGNTTTAVFSEETPQGVVLWIASNACSPAVGLKTSKYLESILQQLVCLREENASQVENDIAIRSLGFCSKRLEDYRKLLKSPLQDCIQYLRQQKSGKDAILKAWLDRVINQLGDLPGLCRMCYKDRHCPALQQIYYFSYPSEKRARDFAEVRHYIGRLGQNFKAAKTMVHAAQLLPQHFDGIRVQRCLSSRPSQPPLLERNPSLEEIIGRMASDRAERRDFHVALNELNGLFSRDLSKEIGKKCESKKWRPRVHAELILLNWAHSQKMKFVSGKKYIACSKPACYCCYYYIIEHGGFDVPATHKNTYLNWRAPDILISADNCESEERRRANIINRLARIIRDDARRQILERRGPSARQHDSTTGISSTVSGFNLNSDFESNDESAAENTADEADELLSSAGENLVDPFDASEDNSFEVMTSNDDDDMTYPISSSSKSFMSNLYTTEVNEFSDNGDGGRSDGDSDSGVML